MSAIQITFEANVVILLWHYHFTLPGVISDGSATTEDGHELSFGVNHLGHFLLTNLLLEKLKKCAPSRIINVSSELYLLGEIDLDSVNKYDGRLKSYPRSKLANILFTRELARILTGSGVNTFSLHPGMAIYFVSLKVVKHGRISTKLQALQIREHPSVGIHLAQELNWFERKSAISQEAC